MAARPSSSPAGHGAKASKGQARRPLSLHQFFETLSTIEAIRNVEARVNALSRLAAEATRDQLAEIMLAIRRSGNEQVVGSMLTELARYFGRELPHLMLEVANLISDFEVRERVFRALQTNCAEDVWDRISIEAVPRAFSPSEFLRALAEIEAIDDARRKASSFEKMIPHLTRDQRARVLELVENVSDEESRFVSTRALVSGLGPIFPDEILRIARTITNERDRAVLMWSLEPLVGNSVRAALLSDAMRFEDVGIKLVFLTENGAYNRLAVGFRSETLALALSMSGNEKWFAVALASIAPFARGEAITAIMAAVADFREQRMRTFVFDFLSRSAHLTNAQRAEIARNLREVGNPQLIAENSARFGVRLALLTSDDPLRLKNFEITDDLLYDVDMSRDVIRDALERKLDRLRAEYEKRFGREAAVTAFARRASAEGDGALDPGMTDSGILKAAARATTRRSGPATEVIPENEPPRMKSSPESGGAGDFDVNELPEMTADDLRNVAARTLAKPWSGKLGKSPSKFISEVYDEWLGKKRLMREHIPNTKAAINLKVAYSKEIRRHPERRLKDLGERPHTRYGSVDELLPVAPVQLNEEQRAIVRKKQAQEKRNQRAKRKVPKRGKKSTKRPGLAPAP